MMDTRILAKQLLMTTIDNDAIISHEITLNDSQERVKQLLYSHDGV